MSEMILFCKSFHKDVYRARRLAESVQRLNRDGMSLYFSVPVADLQLFAQTLEGIPCQLVTDEEILKKTVQHFGPVPTSFSNNLKMQLIKLEFWRLDLCSAYVVIDSDSYFLREFSRKDFMADDQTPLTIRHDAREFRQFAERSGNRKIVEDLDAQSRKFQSWFNRPPGFYDFGPSPYIFSVKVLKSLLTDYLEPNGLTIYELLRTHHPEAYLYGEYLEHSRIIPIRPSGPLFKVFHYAEQFAEAQMLGESEYTWGKDYLGVVIQSNWSRFIDRKKGHWAWIRQKLRGG